MGDDLAPVQGRLPGTGVIVLSVLQPACDAPIAARWVSWFLFSSATLAGYEAYDVRCNYKSKGGLRSFIIASL